MTGPVALLTCGPAEHGICRFGRDLAAAAVEQGFAGSVLHEPDPHRLAGSVSRLSSDVRLVHLQANDWLFTGPGHRAQESIGSFADALRARAIGLSLTLHDLPHPGVPRELFLRRARTYADMMAAAVSVVVSSEHERLLIQEAAGALRAVDDAGAAPLDLPTATVIPLPIPHTCCAIRPGDHHGPVESGAPTVGILGYLYPGKGHREVLHELVGIARPVTVLALGRPSDGHEAMLPDLVETGRAVGVAFRSTGFVPDDRLGAHLRDVDVPVAPAPHVSASASINSWIGAGRRPLVADGRYARELDDRMPGAITRYAPGELRARVESALADPSLTRLSPGFVPVPDRSEVAARYLRVWDGWTRALEQ